MSKQKVAALERRKVVERIRAAMGGWQHLMPKEGGGPWIPEYDLDRLLDALESEPEPQTGA